MTSARQRNQGGDARSLFFFGLPRLCPYPFTDLQPLLLLVARTAALTAFDATGQEGARSGVPSAANQRVARSAPSWRSGRELFVPLM